MEMVIFTGIQASGKSEFYKRNFYKTHIRINLDMLKTRNRENILVDACFRAKQSFVIDNTNATIEERKKYINLALNNDVKIVGYYFKSSISDSIKRNELRIGKEKVPLIAIKSVHSKLVLPNFEEGFEELYYVKIDENNEFVVEEFKDEV